MERIPETAEPEYYPAFSFKGSHLVRLYDCKEYELRLQYPLMPLENSVSECYVRLEVADMLNTAYSCLPSGLHFVIYDAWRPLALQKELYLYYSEKIIRDFGLSDLSEADRVRVISRYVLPPDENPLLPPVHTTGGAIDLTLADSEGNLLPMGTGFDDFSEKVHTAYFENGENDSVRDNRRILYHAMTTAGFTNLPSEWWHYDYGDKFWGYYNNRPAIYKGIFTKGEINI